MQKKTISKRTFIVPLVFVAAIVCLCYLISKDPVSAKADPDIIEMYLGQSKTINAKKKISKTSHDSSLATVSSNDTSLNIYPIKTGTDTIAVDFADGSSKKYTVKISESPIKGEFISIANNSYGNAVLALKFTNDSDKTFENVTVAYSAYVRKTSPTAKEKEDKTDIRQIGEGTEEYYVIRPHETRYLTVVLDKKLEKGEVLDKKKCTFTLDSIVKADYNLDNISDDVEVAVSGVEPKITSTVLEPDVKVNNKAKTKADVVTTILLYDKDGNLIDTWEDESIYPASAESENQYEDMCDGNAVKSEIKTQAFTDQDEYFEAVSRKNKQ